MSLPRTAHNAMDPLRLKTHRVSLRIPDTKNALEPALYLRGVASTCVNAFQTRAFSGSVLLLNNVKANCPRFQSRPLSGLSMSRPSPFSTQNAVHTSVPLVLQHFGILRAAQRRSPGRRQDHDRLAGQAPVRTLLHPRATGRAAEAGGLWGVCVQVCQLSGTGRALNA